MDGRKPRGIEERSFEYALRAIKLYRFLQEGKDSTGWILGKQYLRSATSVGANIAEAQSGQSTADFIHKLTISQKEARESSYWLRLMAQSGLVPHERIQPLIQETDEIITIITTIIRNTKQNKSK